MNGETARKLLTLAGLDAARSILEGFEEIEALRKVGTMLRRCMTAGVPGELAIRACVRTGQLATHPLKALAPLVEGEVRTVVLSGASGTGKTHAAARALGHMGGQWIPAVALNDWSAVQWKALEWRRLVVIDEVDANNAGARIAQHVCNRHDQGWPTIVTCNDVAGWWETVDPASRLRSRVLSPAGVLWPEDESFNARARAMTMRDNMTAIDAAREEALLATQAAHLWSNVDGHQPDQGRAALVLLRAMQVSDAEFLAHLEQLEETRRRGGDMLREAIARGLGK
jgi:hypothetical protein